MDRVELRTKFSSRIEPYRLEEFDMDIHLRPLSALDRARFGDKYRMLEKQGVNGMSETDNENKTIQGQCYIVARGLVDEKGNPIYKDDELSAIAAEIPGKALDEIALKILSISGMRTGQDETIKNSNPTLSADSSIVLQ